LVDGGLIASSPISLAPADGVAIGQEGTSFDISDVALWKTARTPLEVTVDMWANPSTSMEGLMFYGDFTASPPTDLFGSLITTSGVGYNINTPNLRNVGTGYVLPSPDSDLAPDFSAPFSLSVWTRAAASPSGFEVIYANGDSNTAGSWSLCYDNPGLSVNVNTSQGAQSLDLGQFPLGQWTNLTVTWDGTTCSVYVNGQLADSQAFAPSPPVPPGQSMLFAQMASGAPANYYTGHIQALSAWNVCLNASQVEAALFADPSDDPACTAFFACSVNPPADLSGTAEAGIGGQDLLQLVGTDVAYDPYGLDQTKAENGRPGPAAKRDAAHRASGRSRPTPWDRIGIPASPRFSKCHCAPEPAFEPFSQEHVALVKRDMLRALGSVRDPISRRLLSAGFDAKVDALFEAARRDPCSVPQTFTYERRGDRWVVLWHREDGVEVVDEYDAEITPECLAWWATFIWTVLNGMLTLIGIPTPVERARAVIRDYVGDPKFVAGVTLPAAAGMTGAALIQVIAVLYESGLLQKVFWLAFSSLSWWAAGRVLIWLIGFAVPPPALSPQQAMFIANSIVLIAQLGVQLQAYRDACPDAAGMPAPAFG
jgi:hypothetical protein